MTSSRLQAEPTTEAEYLDGIDRRFPYHDEAGWRAAIDLGISISPNAGFAALDELSRPSRSSAAPESQRKRMLAYWRARMKHPLTRILARCAALRIDGKLLKPREAKGIMGLIADYDGLDAALEVVLSVADSASLIDIMVDDIIIRWREDQPAGDEARYKQQRPARRD
jgi:hypothetical protein